jgi:ribosomal protein S18 acetylase RimI-like enzyme
MAGPRVEPLGADDASAAGAVLAASHHDYPAFRLQIPDPQVRNRFLLPFLTAAARDVAICGGLFGAYLDDHLTGVALWQPPGRFPLSRLRKARMTPALLRAAIAAPRAFPRFARSGAALERAFPDEPVWYLETLGIHPDAQRRGIGAALLVAGLAVVDSNHVACHLHTSDEANIGYYKRWGFDLTQPGFSAYPDGPTYYGMTRPHR